MTLSTRVQNKVGPYFDILEVAMSEDNKALARDMLDKISVYFSMLDDEHIDYYQGCIFALEENMVHYFQDDGDSYLEDWDGDALASAGFGTDENYL
jgi:hypothetical protein